MSVFIELFIRKYAAKKLAAYYEFKNKFMIKKLENKDRHDHQ